MFDVAKDNNNLVCGGISPTPTYNNGKGIKTTVKAEFEKQSRVLVKNKVDFLLAEVGSIMQKGP